MTGPEMVGVGVGAGGFALALAGLVFKLGQHSQRLADVEKDVARLCTKAEQHDKELGVVGRLEQRLGTIEGSVREVAHDVKNLLTGRLVPPRRRGAEEA